MTVHRQWAITWQPIVFNQVFSINSFNVIPCYSTWFNLLALWFQPGLKSKKIEFQVRIILWSREHPSGYTSLTIRLRQNQSSQLVHWELPTNELKPESLLIEPQPISTILFDLIWFTLLVTPPLTFSLLVALSGRIMSRYRRPSSDWVGLILLSLLDAVLSSVTLMLTHSASSLPSNNSLTGQRGTTCCFVERHVPLLKLLLVPSFEFNATQRCVRWNLTGPHMQLFRWLGMINSLKQETGERSGEGAGKRKKWPSGKYVENDVKRGEGEQQ